jgi:hypothetical protein
MKYILLFIALVVVGNTTLVAQLKNARVTNSSGTVYNLVAPAGVGGPYTLNLPSGNGTLVTTDSMPNIAWLLGGNVPNDNLTTDNFVLGISAQVNNADNLLLQTDGTTRLSIDGTSGVVTVANGLTVTGGVSGAGANRFAQRVRLEGGATGEDDFTINNNLVTATSVIYVSLENGEAVAGPPIQTANLGHYTVMVTAKTAGASFQVQLSANIPANQNKFLNYVIVNP